MLKITEPHPCSSTFPEPAWILNKALGECSEELATLRQKTVARDNSSKARCTTALVLIIFEYDRGFSFRQIQSRLICICDLSQGIVESKTDHDYDEPEREYDEVGIDDDDDDNVVCDNFLLGGILVFPSPPPPYKAACPCSSDISNVSNFF